MTIKLPKCHLCGNSGFITKAVLSPIPKIAPIKHISDIPIGSYELTKEPCNCPHGEQYKQYLNKTNHPEYENPLEGLSNEEILKYIELTSINQQAIDQEFDLS